MGETCPICGLSRWVATGNEKWNYTHTHNGKKIYNVHIERRCLNERCGCLFESIQCRPHHAAEVAALKEQFSALRESFAREAGKLDARCANLGGAFSVQNASRISLEIQLADSEKRVKELEEALAYAMAGSQPAEPDADGWVIPPPITDDDIPF